MRKLCRVSLVLLVIAAASCATFQVAGQVQKGRQALMMNDPESALGHLLQAADKDPNYIFTSGNFRESVWTYVGQAQYALGRYEDARRSFERALSVYRDDAMAQLYLGLTLARLGDRERGWQQIQAGLKGLYDWIEFLNRSRPYFAFWDPNGQIRKEIDKTLALAQSERPPSLETVLANAEWIGKQMEEEIDKVRRDEQREFRREMDRDGRGGVSVGFGLGW
jgi:tetratricopeptide (TPR) repeat protein